MKGILATIVLLLAVACPVFAQAKPAAPAESASDVAAIHNVRQELRRLTREGDVTSAMALFTDDAIYLRPGEPADIGREAVRRHWQATVDQMIADIDYRADEVEVSGNLAFVRGSATFRGTPRAGGNVVTNEVRYIWILRRHPTAGWQIARYMRQSAPRP